MEISAGSRPDVRAMAAQYRKLVIPPLLVERRRVPDVCPPSHAFQGPLLTAASDHDRSVWPLRTFGLVTGVGDGEIRSLERRLLIGEHPHDDFQALVEPIEAFGQTFAECDPVSIGLQLVPACAQA